MAASADLHGRTAVFFSFLLLLLLPALSASSFPAGVLREPEDHRSQEKLGSADREEKLDPGQGYSSRTASGRLDPSCSLQHRTLTGDYASFDPSPAFVEPPFKSILN